MNLFDLHCDTLGVCYDRGSGIARNGLGVSLEAVRAPGSWAQVFALWIPKELRGDDAWKYYQGAVSHFGKELAEHSDIITQAHSGEDLDRAFNGNRCAGILAVENSSVLGGDLSRLEQLARNGVKMLTLTWNGENEAAHGVDIPPEKWRGGRRSPVCVPGGLKPFGRRLLREMKELNIAADISHLNARGFWEVIGSDTMILASHSNCRAVYGHPRNLSDAQIRALIERRSPIGITFAYLRKGQGKGFFAARRDWSAIHRNISRALELGAQDIICLGTDYDGCTAPRGLENMGKLPNLREYLARRGFTEYMLNRLFFDNAYRWFRQWTFES